MKTKLFLFLFISAFLYSLTNVPIRPPGPILPYLDGVFPTSSPGVSGTWELTDPLPNLNIAAPVRTVSIPRSDKVAILSKRGELWEVDLLDGNQKLLLDIRDQTFALSDGGAVGVAFNPYFGDLSYPDRQNVFLYYRTKPNPQEWSHLGFNRLSKFTWDVDEGKFNEETEDVLIQQFDRNVWHNGGAMLFGPDNYLYLSFGDEGANEYQNVSTQRLDGGFFNGVIRIDVNNDSISSHAIRRQPQSNESPPPNWGATYSQGYMIPNDNPWTDENGEILEEYFAIGTRSPHTMHYDKIRNQFWVADVGSDVREEITAFGKGDNLQWPYKEGYTDSPVHSKPSNLIGKETIPFFEYSREIGFCVIGGGIYNGNLFSSLNGKYIFGDYITNKVMVLTNNGSTTEPELSVLINDLKAEPVTLPEKAGITDVYIHDTGEIYVAVMGEDQNIQGRILQLQQRNAVPEPPSRLSLLNVFIDLESLEPRPGIIPYTVNSPLWSDRAAKNRWVAIPNDGIFDSPSEQVAFNDEDIWDFPEGTVFIKHFELPIDLQDASITQRLETRFFVIGANRKGYGLTYQWLDDQSDAILLGGGDTKVIDIFDDGKPVSTQLWDFPSRDQCITCHNSNSGYVLGVNTHQLNGDFDYSSGRMNQLEYWDSNGIFSGRIGQAKKYLKSSPLTDINTSLEHRIRSYLDSNCSSCHQRGGIKEVLLDFRYSRSKNIAYDLTYTGKSHASNPDNLIITPGDHSASELWVRDASSDDNKMPPLGRNIVDQPYIDSLAVWIDRIEDDPNVYHDLLLYPNPVIDWINIRVNRTWVGDKEVQIFSMSGRLMMHYKTSDSLIAIDVSDLPSTTYNVVIKSGNDRLVDQFVKI